MTTSASGEPERGLYDYPSSRKTRSCVQPASPVPSMPLLNRHGVHIYYEVHGSGRPLILTHGFSMNCTMWHGQIRALAKEFKVIIWDMRGHGRSDYPEDVSAYSQAHTVGDIGALIDETSGSGTIAILGGLSLGGYMSLAFCRAFPSRVAALLLISTGPGFKKDSARSEWNQYAVKTAEKYERDGLSGPQSKRPAETHRNARGLALAARGMLTQQNSVVIDALPSIRVPCLVVVGEDDKAYLAASEYMTKKLPNATRAALRDAGHVVNMERPDEFLEVAQPFLRKFGSPKSTL